MLLCTLVFVVNTSAFLNAANDSTLMQLDQLFSLVGSSMSTAALHRACKAVGVAVV